jgi:drug/metabolite transporter (DMT)-like permease
LFINFRLFDKFNVDRKQAITTNYWVCFLFGYLFLPSKSGILENFNFEWTPLAFLLGFLFFLNFTMTGITVQKLGLTVSSISNKMSLAIPVLFSLFFHNSWLDIQPLAIAGLLLAFIAIYFVSGNSDSNRPDIKKSLLFLPVLIFFLSGFCDSFSQWCNEVKVLPGEDNHFAWLVFGGAAMSSSTFVLIESFQKKATWSFRSILGGITIGLPNYASYYFLLKTLDNFDNQGDLVFPFTNLGVIILTSLISFAFFKDRISRKQWLGLAFSGISLLLISIKK